MVNSCDVVVPICLDTLASVICIEAKLIYDLFVDCVVYWHHFEAREKAWSGLVFELSVPWMKSDLFNVIPMLGRNF